VRGVGTGSASPNPSRRQAIPLSAPLRHSRTCSHPRRNAGARAERARSRSRSRLTECAAEQLAQRTKGGGTCRTGTSKHAQRDLLQCCTRVASLLSLLRSPFENFPKSFLEAHQIQDLACQFRVVFRFQNEPAACKWESHILDLAD